MKEKEKKEELAKTRRKPNVKKNNKRKHTKKILRVLVYITLCVFVLSLLLLICYGVYKLCTSSKYNLSSINFEGNKKYTVEELQEKLDLSEDINLYRISKRDLERKLEEFPYIKDVKISKKYPDTLIISVKEYEASFFAYNQETNKYVKLTKGGIILEECENEAKEEHELIIFGINFDDKLGKEIVEVEKNKLNRYWLIKNEYDEAKINKEITSVEFENGNIILTLDQDINVIMNTQDLEYKLSFLKSILNEISGKAGTINMTIDNPIFSENIK